MYKFLQDAVEGHFSTGTQSRICRTVREHRAQTLSCFLIHTCSRMNYHHYYCYHCSTNGHQTSDGTPDNRRFRRSAWFKKRTAAFTHPSRITDSKSTMEALNMRILILTISGTKVRLLWAIKADGRGVFLDKVVDQTLTASHHDSPSVSKVDSEVVSSHTVSLSSAKSSGENRGRRPHIHLVWKTHTLLLDLIFTIVLLTTLHVK